MSLIQPVRGRRPWGRLGFGFTGAAQRHGADIHDFLHVLQPKREGLALFVGTAEIGDDGGLHRGGAGEFLLARAVVVGLDDVLARA